MTEVIQELSINSAGLSPKGCFNGNKTDLIDLIPIMFSFNTHSFQ